MNNKWLKIILFEKQKLLFNQFGYRDDYLVLFIHLKTSLQDVEK